MSTPRLPSEIVPGDSGCKVLNCEGADNTRYFEEGARIETTRAVEAGCRFAILKAKSPSCGCGLIYDGTFSGNLVSGYGVLARRMRAEGIRVLDESRAAACAAATRDACPGASPAFLAADSRGCRPIETERLVLRPLTADDAPGVFAYCSDPVIGHDAGWEPHRSIDDAFEFLDAFGSLPHVFGMFPKDDSAAPCVGTIGLTADPHRANPDCLSLGYSVARTAWGRGYATEAASAIIRYGFEEVGLSLITCTRFAFNERSRRVIEKCGFVHEGTLHGAALHADGSPADLESYYLSERRWRSSGA